MNAKLAAAKAAVEHVGDSFVVGVGSGTTVSQILKQLAALGRDFVVVPASWQSYYEAIEIGLKVSSIDVFPVLDIYLDSFDQVTEEGVMLKGGGGAFLREKVLATSARRRIFAGESSKLVHKLHRPVPVEVLPFAFNVVRRKLEALGAKVTLRISSVKNGPAISDNGNFLADADFGEITNPIDLHTELRKIPGLLENGLFIDYADKIIMGQENGTTVYLKDL